MREATALLARHQIEVIMELKGNLWFMTTRCCRLRNVLMSEIDNFIL